MLHVQLPLLPKLLYQLPLPVLQPTLLIEPLYVTVLAIEQPVGGRTWATRDKIAQAASILIVCATYGGVVDVGATRRQNTYQASCDATARGSIECPLIPKVVGPGISTAVSAGRSRVSLGRAGDWQKQTKQENNSISWNRYGGKRKSTISSISSSDMPVHFSNCVYHHISL